VVRFILLCLVLCGVAAVPADADTLTPDGPATLTTHYAGPVPPIAPAPPRVLTGWKVTVGSGGRAGTLRLRVSTDAGQTVLGDPVQLPADPGTYMFPAPRVHGSVIGVDQTAGGHAILKAYACRPELGSFGDPCQIWSVQAFKGDPPPGTGGTPDETIAAASLAIETESARDMDSDLRPDLTEDSTDLRVTAAAPQTDRAGGLSVRVTLTNAGPLSADLPALAAAAPADAVIRWADCPSTASTAWLYSLLPSRFSQISRDCFPAALPAGRSRAFTLLVAAGKAVPITLAALSEGPDLHAEDNQISPVVQPLPDVTLTAAKHQRLARGVTAQVRLSRPGRVRVVAAFRVHGHDVRFARTVRLPAGEAHKVTLRPRGRDRRILRAAGRATGSIAARRVGGLVASSARLTVTT